MKFFLGIIVIVFLFCNVTFATILTNPNEIFKAKINIDREKHTRGRQDTSFSGVKKNIHLNFQLYFLKTHLQLFQTTSLSGEQTMEKENKNMEGLIFI